jgi:HrpA-like RNA helicase
MQRRKTPYVTKITFVTTGIFLMRLVNSPDSLKRYTHIIMDEVHERDLDIDFSMVVVKHLLSRHEEENLRFKLILMSATFNTELFANYFSKESIAGVEAAASYVGVEDAYVELVSGGQMEVKRLKNVKQRRTMTSGSSAMPKLSSLLQS